MKNATNNVSRFNTSYWMAYWMAVKRILRYLKGPISYKLVLNTENPNEMIVFSDADWACDVDKRCSCTGYVYKISGGSIAWRSTRQSTVALSSTEAEYMALTATIQEGVWLAQLCDELRLNIKKPIKIMCGNQSAIKLVESGGCRQRPKHIDIRYHFIREKGCYQAFKLEFMGADKMAAESLTKAICTKKTQMCTEHIGVKLGN